jgi:serine/threonine-protein kinase RsbW
VFPESRQEFRRHELDQLHPWFDAVGAKLQLAAPVVFAAQIALEEVVGNIARHALPPGDPQPIVVSAAGSPEHLVLVVEDEGPPFDPTRAPVPPPPADLATAEPGGHGLRLLRYYCPDLRYERRDDRNILTMQFRVNPALG